MVVLTNEVVLLTAFVGNIIYIDHLKNVRESFISVSTNNNNNNNECHNIGIEWKMM